MFAANKQAIMLFLNYKPEAVSMNVYDFDVRVAF